MPTATLGMDTAMVTTIVGTAILFTRMDMTNTMVIPTIQTISTIQAIPITRITRATPIILAVRRVGMPMRRQSWRVQADPHRARRHMARRLAAPVPRQERQDAP